RAARELRGGKRRGLLRGLLLDVLDLVADPLSPATGHTSTPASVARQDPTVGRDVSAILAKLAARPCWEARVRYGVAAPPTSPAPRRAGAPASFRWAGRWEARKRLRGRAHTLASAFGVYSDRNHLARHRLHRPAAALAGRRLGRGDLVCLPELIALAHLPTDTSVPGLARAGAKAVAPLPEIPTSGKLLGDAEAGGHRPVGLGVADARYHLHLMGKTGAGKSSLICNLVLDDLAAGRGVVVIDPKGDLVRDLLERLPERAARKLVLLDPDERQAPPALNVLDGPDPELAVDHLVGIFRNVFAAVWGPRTDDTLRAACLTLLSVPQAQATLADVPRLLMEPAFRQRFTTSLEPRSPLGVFWTSYERTSSHAQAVMVGPVLARLRAFLMRSFVADVVGSASSSFDMAEILDGGLLLARLPKGQLGAETSRLLGSFIVAKVWQAALDRAQQPEQVRADATLAIDECHNYLTDPAGRLRGDVRRGARLPAVAGAGPPAPRPVPPRAARGDQRQRPQQALVHHVPGGRSPARTPRRLRPERARPGPSWRLAGRLPACGRRPRAARLHPADPTRLTAHPRPCRADARRRPRRRRPPTSSAARAARRSGGPHRRRTRPSRIPRRRPPPRPRRPASRRAGTNISAPPRTIARPGERPRRLGGGMVIEPRMVNPPIVALGSALGSPPACPLGSPLASSSSSPAVGIRAGHGAVWPTISAPDSPTIHDE
ncbi:MAG TPA: hypothetical protein VE664_01985, partial [Actinomycetes bacterium]|nr:hypothetical protein [Actinomycetes bacterium]